MARVIMTFEDLPNNRVKVELSPRAGDLILGAKNNRLTSAEAYALKCANVVRAEGKKKSPLILDVPRGLVN